MNALGLDEQHALLRLVVERLERCNVPYMVAGSVAANSYTAARATNDIDIVIKIVEDDIDKLIAAFEGDFYINSRDAIQDSLKRYYPFNVIYLESVAKVDLVPLPPDQFAQSEFGRRRLITIENESYWYISPEDYIISKLRVFAATRSERQLSDLRNVLETQRNVLNLDYLRSWADRFDIRNELDALL